MTTRLRSQGLATVMVFRRASREDQRGFGNAVPVCPRGGRGYNAASLSDPPKSSSYARQPFCERAQARSSGCFEYGGGRDRWFGAQTGNPGHQTDPAAAQRLGLQGRKTATALFIE